MKFFTRTERIESVADQLVHEWAEFIALPREFEPHPARLEPRDTDRDFAGHPLRLVDG